MTEDLSGSRSGTVSSLLPDPRLCTDFVKYGFSLTKSGSSFWSGSESGFESRSDALVIYTVEYGYVLFSCRIWIKIRNYFDSMTGFEALYGCSWSGPKFWSGSDTPVIYTKEYGCVDSQNYSGAININFKYIQTRGGPGLSWPNWKKDYPDNRISGGNLCCTIR